jgi:hypothetical protein
MTPCPHVRATVTNDGLIVLDIRTGQIFSANRVGARIWSAIEEGLAMPAIVERIAADTGADPVVVERDTSDFVDTLRARSLVTGEETTR